MAKTAKDRLERRSILEYIDRILHTNDVKHPEAVKMALRIKRWIRAWRPRTAGAGGRGR